MPDFLHDGDFSGPVEIGPPRSEFPFRINGDRTAEYFEQDYWQKRDRFVAANLGIEHRIYDRASAFGCDRPGFFLGIETKPAPLEIGAGLVKYTRTWFRIPGTQTEYSAKYVTKPDIGSSSDIWGQVRDWTPAIFWSGIVAAYNFGGSAFIKPYFYPTKFGTTSTYAATGGTFTLTYKASTTAALAYNALESTIAAALNGLASSIADGVTWIVNVNAFTGADNQVLILFNNKGVTTPVTANIASLTTAGPKVVFTKVYNGGDQRIHLAQKAVIPSHGFDATKDLIIGSTAPFMKVGGTLAGFNGWSIIDSNSIAFTHFQIEYTASITMFAQQGGSYSPGITNSRIKKITDFYWPGVTPGINSADDIPLAAYQGDATSIVTAVVNGTTAINLEVGDLANWMGTPILARTRIVVDASKL